MTAIGGLELTLFTECAAGRALTGITTSNINGKQEKRCC
jgi:hypothetical protein